jgi:hypothetical protein
MPNTPATLTQYILHLLEKEENREKFNIRSYQVDYPLDYPLDEGVQVDLDKNDLQPELTFGYWNNSSFDRISKLEQREVIRIALLSLVEFQVLNNEYRSMKNELLHDTINGDEQPYTEGVLDTMPKTLAQKYGQMLYDKSIEEIDEIFKSENICI